MLADQLMQSGQSFPCRLDAGQPPRSVWERQPGTGAELQRCWKLKRLSAKALMHMKRMLKPTSTAAAGPMKLHLQPLGVKCPRDEHLAEEQQFSDKVCLSRRPSRVSRDAYIVHQIKQQ